MKNPWHVPEREAQALDAVLRHGTHAPAAASLGIARKTLEVHIVRAYTQMRLREGNASAIGLFVMWAKWRIVGDPYYVWRYDVARNF